MEQDCDGPLFVEVDVYIYVVKKGAFSLCDISNFPY